MSLDKFKCFYQSIINNMAVIDTSIHTSVDIYTWLLFCFPKGVDYFYYCNVTDVVASFCLTWQKPLGVVTVLLDL